MTDSDRISVKRCTRIAVIQTMYAGLFLDKCDDIEYLKSISDDIIGECMRSYGPLDRRTYKKLLDRSLVNLTEIISLVQNSSNRQEMDMLVKAILYPGIAELLFLDSNTSYKLIINEYTDITTGFDQDSVGFINGIMDNIAKQHVKDK